MLSPPSRCIAMTPGCLSTIRRSSTSTAFMRSIWAVIRNHRLQAIQAAGLRPGVSTHDDMEIDTLPRR
ncbi:hypothetical protein KCP77_00160 [Salmonella enterica subsp. enterica]|nr:hypothetical protein KCP77_00160 [Salmonella enterica subsp. enterica]